MFKPGQPPFEYMYMIFDHVESTLCETCVFRKLPHEYDNESMGPMCFEIEAKVILEEPVEEWTFDDGMSCDRYRKGDPTPEPVEGQGELF